MWLRGSVNTSLNESGRLDLHLRLSDLCPMAGLGCAVRKGHGLHLAAMGMLVVLSCGMSVVAQSVTSGPVAGPVDPNQGNPCSIQWFEAHGWLMWLAFGVFFPIGILVSRYGQFYFRQWFYTHIALQVL